MEAMNLKTDKPYIRVNLECSTICHLFGKEGDTEDYDSKIRDLIGKNTHNAVVLHDAKVVHKGATVSYESFGNDGKSIYDLNRYNMVLKGNPLEIGTELVNIVDMYLSMVLIVDGVFGSIEDYTELDQNILGELSYNLLSNDYSVVEHKGRKYKIDVKDSKFKFAPLGTLMLKELPECAIKLEYNGWSTGMLNKYLAPCQFTTFKMN